MKAQSTIRKEIQRLWRQKRFYENLNDANSIQRQSESQCYGAAEALRWALGEINRFSRSFTECNDHKAQASESGEGE